MIFLVVGKNILMKILLFCINNAHFKQLNFISPGLSQLFTNRKKHFI